MKKNLLLIFIISYSYINAIGQNTCSTAQNITAGTYSFSLVDGTQVPTPICAPGGAGATAGKWFSYTPTQNYSVTVTTDFPINGNIDNRVHIYNGTCMSLNCVAGDDDSGTGLLCVVFFNAVAGVTYYIAFDNRWSNAGFTFELIEANTPPPSPISFTMQNFSNIFGTYKIAVADMNNDYLDDIVSVSNANIYILYQQTNGTFVQASFNTTPAQYDPSWSMAIGDYNKDGYNDLLYGGGNGVTFFYSNNTGTAYTQFYTTDYVFSQRSNFVDLNNDGHLDAFVCHDVAPNVYYMNDGSGNLTFYQGGLGNHPNGGNYGSIFIDYDNDGDVDLFIAKCRGGAGTAKLNELHRNNGNGTFTNVSVSANMNHPNQTWSSAWNDFDNDGDMDAVIGASSFSDGGHLFMRNNGDGTFSDITTGSGWDTYSGTAIEYVSYDFNNDGWADVFTNGRMALNNGNNTFTFHTITPNVGPIGDLNNDGFLDIQNGNTVYYTMPNGNNWIKLNLKGIQSNSYGIGARIEIYGVWGKQIRDIQSGIGFRNMGTLNAHFGIGQATSIDSVVVRWPSGVVDKVCNPNINTNLFIQEGTGIAPVAAFSPSATIINTSDVVNFTDASTACPNNWQWSVIPANGWVYVNGTTSNSVNPQIQFNNQGVYDVSLQVSNQYGVSANNTTVQITVNTGVGITEESIENLISVFPNPSSTEVNITYTNKKQVTSVSIMNSLGEIISSFSRPIYLIDISKLSDGVYYLVIEIENGVKQTKLLVKN